MSNKAKILKIAKDLENEVISEDKARMLLLGLFGTPLSMERVTKLLSEISLKAFIECGKTKEDWKTWWDKRSKININ